MYRLSATDTKGKCFRKCIASTKISNEHSSSCLVQTNNNICPMCRFEDEDIIHFLLKCPLLAGSRQEPFRRLKNEVINNSEDGTWLRIFNSDERITTLIVGIIQKHLWKVLV